MGAAAELLCARVTSRTAPAQHAWAVLVDVESLTTTPSATRAGSRVTRHSPLSRSRDVSRPGSPRLAPLVFPSINILAHLYRLESSNCSQLASMSQRFADCYNTVSSSWLPCGTLPMMRFALSLFVLTLLAPQAWALGASYQDVKGPQNKRR